MLRRGTVARSAVVLALVFTALGMSTTTARAAHVIPVKETTVTFVDTSRPTSANGTYPGAPTRTLATYILYPERNDHDQKRYPLIVFAHGFTASGPSYQFLLRDWAAAGYIVAAPTFPLSSAGAPGGSRLGDYVNQPADVSFVISQMLALDSDPRSPLYRNVDARRIGVAGHSLGAVTTLGVAWNKCCQDPRIDAAIAISGIRAPFPDGAYFTGERVPLLLIHGTADGTVPYAGSRAAYEAAAPPKYLLTLHGAGHVPFFGAYDSVVDNTVVAFFDAYLVHRGRLEIERVGNVDGVATIESVPLCRPTQGCTR
jgi:predicted dienelactone hydrolase